MVVTGQGTSGRRRPPNRVAVVLWIVALSSAAYMAWRAWQ